MIAILGSLLGFFSSSIPSIIKVFQDKADKAHELAMMQLQIDYAKQNQELQLKEVQLQQMEAQQEALYKTYDIGITFIDALNGSVRPVLSYCFFFLYAYIKYMQFKLIGPDAPLSVHFDVLWTDNDSIIFSGIIAFYFGSNFYKK